MSDTPRSLVSLTVFAASVVMAGAAGAEDLRFTPDIQRLLSRNCAACHNSQDAQGGLDLEPDHAYANLVGKRSTQCHLALVEPGKPDGSYLYRKLVGTHVQAGGQGEAMPTGGALLPANQIDAVRRWIELGAR